jgi:hypothetical protein
MYDISTATDAIYTDAAHAWFNVTVEGVPMHGKVEPGMLVLYDGLIALGIPIAPYVAPPPPPPTAG